MKQTFSFSILLLFFLIITNTSQAQCGFSIQILTQDVSCNGLQNGMATVSISGGTGPFSCVFQSPIQELGLIADSLAPGNYSVVVTDSSNFCSDTAFFSINNPMPLNLSTSPTLIDCANPYASVALSAAGGTPPYNFNPGNANGNTVNGNFVLGVNAGNHWFYVGDANGCIDSTFTTINGNGLIIGANIQQPTCGNCDGSISVFVQQGTAPIQYTWSDGSTGPNLSGICPGIRILTASDAFCTITDTFYFSSGNLSLNPIATKTNCTSCSGILVPNAQGGTAPYSYSLDNGANYISADTIFNLCAYGYSIITKDANGCEKIHPTPVQTPQNLNWNISSQGPVCGVLAGYIHSTVSGGVPPYLFSINGGPFSGTANYNGLAEGTYQFSMKDALGCQRDTTIVLLEHSGIYITYNNIPPSSCSACDGVVNVVGISGFPAFGMLTYELDFTYTTMGSGYFPTVCAGMHTMTITNQFGCSATDTFFIQSPGFSASSVASPGTCSPCNGAITITATGGTPPYQYALNNGTPQSSGNFLGLCNGTFSYTATDASGCSFSGTTELLPNGIPGLNIQVDSVNAPSSSTLNDGGIFLSISGPTAPYSLLWNTGASTDDLFNLPSGTFELLITDSGGNCEKWDTTILHQNQLFLLSGTIFRDTSLNCTYESGEPGLANVSVIAQNGNQIFHGLTNPSGAYGILVPAGVYTISLNQSNLTLPCNTSYLVPAPSGQLDFALIIDTTSQICISGISGNGAVIGMNSSYHVELQNNGLSSANGMLRFVMPSDLVFLNSNPSPNQINGDTLIYSITNLTPAMHQIIDINYHTPSTLGLGFPLLAQAFSTITTPANPPSFCNTASCHHVTLSSYDPNDKSVSPLGEEGNGELTVDQDTLTYLIRFQNTGTSPAIHIVITDTLSSLLDINSLYILQASHDYDVEIDNQLIRFRFNNIMLPDSGSNEALSHGFILFRINTLLQPIVGDSIPNTAAIYFDYNAPVITNTTKTKYIEIIQTPDGIGQASSLTSYKVFPNPANEVIQILGINKHVQIEITDLSGRTVLLTGANHDLSIDIAHLAQGIYYMSIRDSNESYFQKIVVRR